MADSLLHLISTTGWRAALAAGVLAPTHGERFVHLSTPAQVALPAGVHFAGRADVALLAVDPTGLDVRYEPGMPHDPAGMTFPHAYGGVPTSAVLAVLPYRPGPAGYPPPPAPPTRADLAARAASFEASVLRRTATEEVAVTGGVAVLTPRAPGSRRHNQLLLDAGRDDAMPDAATVAAEADRVLGGAGLAHRTVRLSGPGADATAAAMRGLGWSVQRVVTLAALADGIVAEPAPAEAAVPDHPEAAVIDLRILFVRDPQGEVVGSASLAVDGATARLDAAPDHGDAVLLDALATAGRSGCDLVVLHVAADEPARAVYARRGLVEAAEYWVARR